MGRRRAMWLLLVWLVLLVLLLGRRSLDEQVGLMRGMHDGRQRRRQHAMRGVVMHTVEDWVIRQGELHRGPLLDVGMTAGVPVRVFSQGFARQRGRRRKQ